MKDRGAIQVLYAASYQRLVLQLYPMTGDLNEAQDVVQEAFVRLLATPSRLASLDNPEAWLRTVAVNLARSRWRRGKLLQRLLRRLDPEPAQLPGVSADHLALVSALRQLPAGQRAAITLHYLADLPIREVAETLQISAGTVKSRLARGRNTLAALLGGPAAGRALPTSATERSAHNG